MTVKPIIAGTDGSEESLRAADAATRLEDMLARGGRSTPAFK